MITLKLICTSEFSPVSFWRIYFRRLNLPLAVCWFVPHSRFRSRPWCPGFCWRFWRTFIIDPGSASWLSPLVFQYFCYSLCNLHIEAEAWWFHPSESTGILRLCPTGLEDWGALWAGRSSWHWGWVWLKLVQPWLGLVSLLAEHAVKGQRSVYGPLCVLYAVTQNMMVNDDGQI